MKKILPVLLIAFFVMGCFSLDVKDSARTQVLVSIATRNIACEIKMSGDVDLDQLVRDVWESVKLGELSPGLYQRISDLTSTRPTLAADILDLTKLLGLQVDMEGIAGFEEITPEMMATIEKAYVQGFNMCRVAE